MTPAPTVGDGDLETFIGRNAGYYLTEKRVMDASGSRLSWNWPAFLFTFAWMAYRRMWGAAALVGALTVFLAASLVLAWAAPVLMLVLGLYGNALYLDHARRRAARIGLLAEAEEARRRRLARSGGVSWPAAVVAVGLALVAALAVALLWGGLLAVLFGGFVWWHMLDGLGPR